MANYCEDSCDIPYASASTAVILIQNGLNIPNSKEGLEEMEQCEIKCLNETDRNIHKCLLSACASYELDVNEPVGPHISFRTFKIVEPDRFLDSPAPPPKMHFTVRWQRLTRKLYQAKC